MSNGYCCEFMRQQLTHTCEKHGDGSRCPSVVIERARFKFGEGELILIARNAEYTCNFCPHCGIKWPGAKLESSADNEPMVTENAIQRKKLCPYAASCRYDISECLTCTGPNRVM